MDFKWMTLKERPDLAKEINSFHSQFPLFVREGDRLSQHYWNGVGLYEHFPEFQFALCNVDGKVVGCGHTIPIVWNGTIEGLPSGYDEALELGFIHQREGKKPNTLCALAAITSPEHKGAGLSYAIIKAMRSLAQMHELDALIAPVRPTWKAKYPLTTIEDYVEWKNSHGEPFDPWLRVHWRLGGKMLGIADPSMTISGTVSEWEEWTEMPFPESGEYVVPQAFHPIRIDRKEDRGIYVEPNVWIKHTVEKEERHDN